MKSATHNDVKNAKYTPPRTGNRAPEAACLNCRQKLSFCGKPFTADLQCPRCGAVNAYEGSFEPIRLKDRIEVFDVKVAP